MTENMVGFQLNFGRKTHRKARWKRARKRWLIRNDEKELIPWSDGREKRPIKKYFVR